MKLSRRGFLLSAAAVTATAAIAPKAEALLLPPGTYHGTVTGRWVRTNPNFQELPRKEGIPHKNEWIMEYKLSDLPEGVQQSIIRHRQISVYFDGVDFAMAS